MRHAWLLLALKVLSARSAGPQGAITPLARACGPSSANVVCVNHYASVMPYHFSRDALAYNIKHVEDSFRTTTIPSDPSFDQVGDADFLIFDEDRALPLLGDNPRNDYLFSVSNRYHEAPVYAPKQNRLFFSQSRPRAFCRNIQSTSARSH